jgi:hypothetical protein
MVFMFIMFHLQTEFSPHFCGDENKAVLYHKKGSVLYSSDSVSFGSFIRSFSVLLNHVHCCGATYLILINQQSTYQCSSHKQK